MRSPASTPLHEVWSCYLPVINSFRALPNHYSTPQTQIQADLACRHLHERLQSAESPVLPTVRCILRSEG